MKIALYGGTFDPVHVGHLKAAEAALSHFHLDQVLFIPSGQPPHKPHEELTPFVHRFSMVALACAGITEFVPSLLEARARNGRACYSVDTVRRVRRRLKGRDHLYFLIGVDAFLEIRTWLRWTELFHLVDFIIVSRPGFRMEQIEQALPCHLPVAGRWRRSGATRRLCLKRSTIYLLEGVDVPVSAHAIRQAVRRSQSLSGLVPRAVEEYIRKENLYRSSARGQR